MIKATILSNVLLPNWSFLIFFYLQNIFIKVEQYLEKNFEAKFLKVTLFHNEIKTFQESEKT